MPYCKYCGAPHDDDAAFCTECGKPITRKAPPVPETVEVTHVDGGERPYIPGDPIPPEMEKQVKESWSKVQSYTLSIALLKQLFRTNPGVFDEEDWKKAEAALAEKYGLTEISIFRQRETPDFEPEEKPTQPQHRRNKSYTKRDTEYWAKFEKPKEEE